jgi:LPS export ABC transporter protein LptC
MRIKPRAPGGRGAYLLAIAALCISACSLDYEDAMVQETMAESVPDVVLRNVEHNVVREGKVTAHLEATQATQYEKRNETLLENVYFRESSDEGELLTEMWADKATWHSDTEDAEASGDIYVHSFKEEAEVYAQSLRWKKADRTLVAGETEQVVLRRDDGSELRGTGFSADFRSNEIRLKAAHGVYIYDEDKGTEATPGTEATQAAQTPKAAGEEGGNAPSSAP